jgi:hypothetical protein
MFVTDSVADYAGALGRYRGVLSPVFEKRDLENLYLELFGDQLAKEVNWNSDLHSVLDHVLQICKNHGSHLVQLLLRVLRMRAANKAVVEQLATILNLTPVIEIADLLVASGCPEDLRPAAAQRVTPASAHGKPYHHTGRAGWIDFLVWLEELPEGGRPRPPLLDCLERIELAWRATGARKAEVLADWLAELRRTHGIAPQPRIQGGAHYVDGREPTAPPPAPAIASALPIAVLSGKQAPLLATEAGEWFVIEPDGTLVALPATGPFAAAIADAASVVTVACWDGSIKQLRGRVWAERALLEAPAVALASSARGVVAGDASGGLSLIATGPRPAVAALIATAPIVELGTADDMLVALDSSGLLVATRWPLAGDDLAPVTAEPLGRPYALYPGIRAATVIAVGSRGLGVIAGDRLTATVAEPGIRAVIAFRDQARACVVTDSGAAWIVDGSLAKIARIRIGPAGIAGAASGGDGNLLAWTTDGDLLSVRPDGAVRRLIEGDVVLAAPDPDGISGYLAVHWTAEREPRVSRGEATWI